MTDYVYDPDEQLPAETLAALFPAARAGDYNYELRHPGHGDQSVHNPRKGGGVPAGFVRPRAINPSDASAVSGRAMSDSEFYLGSKANGLDPNTLEPDAFTSADKVTPQQFEAVARYKGQTNALQGAVMGVQGRETDAEFAQSRKQAQSIKSVLESRELSEPATLHRGMGQDMTSRLQQVGVGGVVKTDRFVSTSASSRVANNFGYSVLEINAPAGTKGAFIDRILLAGSTPQRQKELSTSAKYSANPAMAGEMEFVMPPGIKFRVDTITTTTRQRYGKTQTVPLVKVTVLP